MARVVVVGGGAAGTFGAIAAARRGAKVTILEATNRPLRKVLVSGGGRCNVMHKSQPAKSLCRNYPRGSKELLGPFTTLFTPEQTAEWFEQAGVQLKTEADGRCFPITDDSRTVACALETAAAEAGVETVLRANVRSIEQLPDGTFHLQYQHERSKSIKLDCAAVLLATGSSPHGYQLATNMGHQISQPFPSLFSFRLLPSALTGLQGVSLPNVELGLRRSKGRPKHVQQGPLLVTHRGISGPAALRLSAFAAQELQQQGYKGELALSLVPGLTLSAAREALITHASSHGAALVVNSVPELIGAPRLPRSVWAALVQHAGTPEGCRWTGLSKKCATRLAELTVSITLQFSGKDTNKEEFVTAGGVELGSLWLSRMESRALPGLHFAGELLNVDGVTGGFNFQACWTTGHVAGEAAADRAMGTIS